MRRHDGRRTALALMPDPAPGRPRTGGRPLGRLRGSDGPGKGKHVVLISGDEEYRSEEALPQLAKILAKRHGFKCTVLFAIGKDGTIDPNRHDNIPGLEALRSADLMIIATRFRNLPDDQMKDIVDYVESGRPIIGMRTATHAFNLKGPDLREILVEQQGVEGRLRPAGAGRDLGQPSRAPRQGEHARDHRAGARRTTRSSAASRTATSGARPTSTRSIPARRLHAAGPGPGARGHEADRRAASTGKKNDPMMPVAWVKTYTGAKGKPARVFTTTMGAATDLESEGTRRLLVNAAYWAVGLEDKITGHTDVALVGEYHPLPFGFGKAKKGVQPSSFVIGH